MIAAFAIVATIIAIACGVLIYAVGNISQSVKLRNRIDNLWNKGRLNRLWKG